MAHDETTTLPAEAHRPALITWGEKHSVPGEVCMGCSDPDNGVWVPVMECEEARALMEEDDPGSLCADLYFVDGALVPGDECGDAG